MQINNKDILERLLDEVKAIHLQQVADSAEIKEVKAHVMRTNGKVAETISDVIRIEKDMHEEGRRLERETRNYILYALIAGSFLWIKESRDVIISLLKSFV